MTDQELLQAISTMMDEKIAPIYSRMDKLDSRMDKLDSRVDKLDSRMDKLEKEVQEIKADVLELKVTQEGVILPDLKLLAEGHENILEHIQEKIDAKTDRLQDEVDVLTIVVKRHSQDIAELKKAQ